MNQFSVFGPSADGNARRDDSFAETGLVAGTMLATPGGDVAVEHLAVGDLVTTTNGPRAVIAISRRDVEASKQPDPAAALPMRVRAGALAENVPRRDMLIGPEQSLYVNGGLTPVRLLLNDRSITLQRDVDCFTYYQVTLSSHALLIAEGAVTDSYLDNGARDRMSGAAGPHPGLGSPEVSHVPEYAAPLVVEQDAVAAVWRVLDERARILDLAKTDPASAADDLALYLMTEAGLAIRPLRRNGDHYFFMLPGGTRTVSLRSRIIKAQEADAEGNAVETEGDKVAVKVGSLMLWLGRRGVPTREHLSKAVMEGWSVADGDGRWTTGDAVLPLDLAVMRGRPSLAEVQVFATGADRAPADEGGDLARGEGRA